MAPSSPDTTTMAATATQLQPPADQQQPLIRISKIAGRYLVFDIEDAMRLRRQHNMCGVFVGSIPQNPQQNVFMGMPMELLAEEAAVLVAQGVGRVADDAVFHPARLASLAAAGGGGSGKAQAYLDGIRGERKVAEDEAAEQMRQMRLRQAQHIKKAKTGKKQRQQQSVPEESGAGPEDGDSLFSGDGPRPHPRPPSTTSTPAEPPRQTFGVTPATSGALLLPDEADEEAPPRMDMTDVPASYPLYAHLHGLGYYMMPGLRFGCHYNVYPGDPLRFHSHFQASSFGWDEEITMLDIVAGGRLGTGVKKGFLIGGAVQPEGDNDAVENNMDPAEPLRREVRTFCVEWAGM